MGHLKCDHGIWLTIANVLASGTISLPIISGVVEESFMRWLRAAELTCDRAAMLVAQDHKIVISTLMKLAGGSPGLANELNIDAFLRQVRHFFLLLVLSTNIAAHLRFTAFYSMHSSTVTQS